MLTTNLSKAVFNGNGVATDFPFTFKVWEKGQLLVEITDLENKDSFATVWDVLLTDSGGVITYLHDGAPLPTGYKLTILRNMPFLQEVDLITGTRFDPTVIETQLDKATAERQQLREEINRAIKVPASSSDPSELLAQEIFDARDQANTSANNAVVSAQEAEANKNATQNIYEQTAGMIPQIEAARDGAITAIQGQEETSVSLVKDAASAATSNAVESITAQKDETLAQVSGAGISGVESINTAKNTALVAIDASKTSALTEISEKVDSANDAAALAAAWAESDTAPDPSDPNSRSAKWWAQQGGQGVPDATETTKGKVQYATAQEIMAGTGDGVVRASTFSAGLSAVASDVASAKQSAQEAASGANAASGAASSAQDTANTAKNTAEAAQQTAQSASQAASTAQNAANTANDTATTAEEKAQSALDTFSTTMAPDKAPLALADGTFDESWKMGGSGFPEIFWDDVDTAADGIFLTAEDYYLSTKTGHLTVPKGAILQIRTFSNSVSYTVWGQYGVAYTNRNSEYWTRLVDETDITYRVIYGTGQKSVYDPNNDNAIEDDALGNNGVIAKASRYVLDNPFGINTPVICYLELNVNNEWFHVPFVGLMDSGGNRGGTFCGYKEGEGIIIQTHNDALGRYNPKISGVLGNVEGATTSGINNVPCRIHVWKVGV